MVIYIVRHGHTEENQQRILQGHMPGNLTEEGKQQVRRDWGKYTGMALSEAKDKYFHNGGWDFPDSAETDEQILERAKKALKELSEEYGDSNIIVVTHGQFARNMVAARFDCSYHEVASFMNAEVRTLKIYDDHRPEETRYEIRRYNNYICIS